ncbi:MAG: Carbonic anhydrase, eukaryotic [Proteobacteria bacterium]|nr:Carbonic anhydrase, eukaryotic [Pseudomonadota bacterium]
MRLSIIGLVLLSGLVQAAPTWQLVSSEPGKRIELDRAGIKREEGNKVVALARLVVEKEISDTTSGGTYRIMESLTRYECVQRNAANLKRVYRKSETEILREEELKGESLPVRSGTLDDKILREVCRPQTAAETQAVLDRANEAATQLKVANQALIDKEKAKATKKPATKVAKVVTPVARKHAPAKPKKPEAVVETHQHTAHWSYSGEGAPENWHKLDPRFKLCGSGQRQSPIDIQDSIRVDLEPIQFNYRMVPFSILDNGHSIEAVISNGSITVTGKTYDLFGIHFHRPSEEKINGKRFDMVAHLVHKSDDGRLAVVAVLMEKGMENRFIQTLWNNLPLEKKMVVSPPNAQVDPMAFLPVRRDYYTYMGSLTTPPCTEGVLWLVLKQPVAVSQEQIEIFSRFYIDNTRPVQPAYGRIIKEGR